MTHFHINQHVLWKHKKIKDKLQLNYNRSCDMLESQKKHHALNMLSKKKMSR